MKSARSITISLANKQTNNIVKKFKTKIGEQSKATNIVATDSLAVDSSIFVIEAALNYDYNYDLDSNYIFEHDTCVYAIPFNSITSKVKSDDLETAYDALSISISSKLDVSTKVRLIDITAHLSDDGTDVIYQAETVLLKIANVIPAGTIPCNVSSSANFYISKQAYFNWGCLTGYNSTYFDAVYEMNLRLNCLINELSCGVHNYFSDIQTGGYNTYPGDVSNTIVYQSTNNLSSYYCTNKPSITGTDVSNYITNQNYWALVTYPAFASLTGYTLYHKVLFSNEISNGSSRSVGWQLVAYYGVCKERSE